MKVFMVINCGYNTKISNQSNVLLKLLHPLWPIIFIKTKLPNYMHTLKRRFLHMICIHSHLGFEHGHGDAG